jgi:hypothetical protein
MDVWLKSQPWFVRLDEWQHRHFPKHLGMLWYRAWRPLCNLVEIHHMAGTHDMAGLTHELTGRGRLFRIHTRLNQRGAKGATWSTSGNVTVTTTYTTAGKCAS